MSFILTIKLALAFELLLVCVEGIWPRSRSVLPLGGSHLAQLGAVLSVAVALTEIWEIILGRH